MEEFDSQIMILDDGFQHRRLHRDLDIVLIDATLPFGFDRLLPRGLLREPLSALRRADLIILTRTDLVNAEIRDQTIARIRKYAPDQPLLETRNVVAGLRQNTGQQVSLEHLAGQPIFFFCGIGNPDSFEVSLHHQGFDIRGSEVFPDHHRFSPDELIRIGESAKACGAAAIVCTHKDLVKVSHDQLNGLPLYAMIINVEFLSGQQTIESNLNQLVEQARIPRP
jgi:tetraacyldisaccharide 4'-kinase